MVTQATIIKYLKLRKAYFLSEYKVTKIGLFGSFSRGESTLESDIDLLIEFEPNTENLYSLKSKLRKELSQKFNRRIDLCREKYLKPYYKDQILESTLYA